MRFASDGDMAHFGAEVEILSWHTVKNRGRCYKLMQCTRWSVFGRERC